MLDESQVCVTTVVSGERYASYVPLFEYAWKKAFPSTTIRIFYSDNQEMAGIERFLIGKKNFNEKYIFITDIDIIYFRYKKNILEYMVENMGKWPIAAKRGACKSPVYDWLKKGWRKEYARLAAGYVMLKNPEWFDKTKKARINFNPIRFFREMDEVWLARFCRQSGIKISSERGCFANGKEFDKNQKYFHLGEFRNKFKYNTIKKKISRKSSAEFLKLNEDPKWKQIIRKSPIYIQNEIKEAIRFARRRCSK